jgi:ankyrin repeat protein
MENRRDVLEFLVVNLNAPTTPNSLFYAVRYGSLDIVKFLVERNLVNVNENYVYSTPIYEAIVYNRVEVGEYLLEKGAVIDTVCMLDVIKKSSLEFVRMCVNFYNPSLGLLNDMLYIACDVGSLETVDFLVSRGADVRSMSDEALRTVSRNGYVDVVEYLIRAGANVHADDDAAVRMASLNKHFEVVRVLCEAGANRTMIHPKSEKYLQLIERTRDRAQKKIYFWWIPICYDPKRDSGKRMMARSWEETQALLMTH